MTAKELARLGRFEEAVAAVGGPASGLDFDVAFDPTRVLLVDGRETPTGGRAAITKAARAAARVSDEALRLLLQGALAACAGTYERGLGLLARAAVAAPGDPWPLLWSFRCRVKGDFMTGPTRAMLESLELLDRAAALAPDNRHVFTWRSRALKGLNLVAAALEDMDRAVALEPGDDWARLGRANIRAELGKRAEALADCARVRARRPSEPWVWAMQARVKARCGDLGGCLGDLDRALELSPDFGAAIYAWRGEARRQAGKPRGAREDFARALSMDPGCALALQWRGRFAMLAGRPAEALRWLDRCLARAPVNPLARAYRWQLRLEAGRFEEALEDFWRFGSMRPEQFWAPDRGAAGVRRGLDRLVARFPKESWAWAWRGRVLELMERPAAGEAEAAFARALSLSPRHAWARLWSAQALYRRRGAQEALPELSRAAALEFFGAAAGALGRALLDLGRVEEAVRSLDRACALRPDDNELAVWRGEALARAGRADEALRELSAARCAILHSAAPHYWRAQALLSAGRALEAKREAARALELSRGGQG